MYVCVRDTLASTPAATAAAAAAIHICARQPPLVLSLIFSPLSRAPCGLDIHDEVPEATKVHVRGIDCRPSLAKAWLVSGGGGQAPFLLEVHRWIAISEQQSHCRRRCRFIVTLSDDDYARHDWCVCVFRRVDGGSGCNSNPGNLFWPMRSSTMTAALLTTMRANF